MEKETVILTCSSLERYVKRAQEKMHTNYPIIVIDRIYHVEPATMKTVIWQELEKRKRKPDTILAAMGFCGGVCDQVRAQVRTPPIPIRAITRSLGPGAGTGKDCDSKSR